MRRLRLTILIALATMLLTATVSAQSTASTSVPNLIRYSGTLKDAQGALVSTAPIGVTFAIYNQEDGGAAVWQETQNVTLGANGQYSVILGSATAAGLPGDLFSQQEQRWLGVQVQGQEEQPRVLLVSVPYALKAHEADTLGGMPASAIIQAATSAATSSALANGTSVNALSNAGTPAGARAKDGKLPPNGCLEVSGWITYWNINGALCPSNLFQVFNPASKYLGNIGIGTQNPSTAFDVFGAIDVSPVPKAVPTDTGNYQILEYPVLSIGWPSNETIIADQNTWLGVFAGGQGTGIPPTNGYDSGTSNTFVGFDAAQHNATGSSNVAVGVNAEFRNVDGNNNTTVGVSAGFGPFVQNINNTTIMGYQAGVNNTASNVAFYGYKAGAANTANGNSFFGYTAGTANTSGSSDTFLGNLAGTANITGNGDTFIGDSAGAANVSGNDNTFTGQNAGKANTANGNSFYGYNSGPANSTGIQNVFMGWQTGLVNTSGISNVFMGYQAGQANVDQSYNTYVGANAGYNVDSSGNTLLGYAAGQNTTGASGYGITAVGYDAGRANTTGTLNAYFGVNAGFNYVGGPAQTGSYNTYLGNGAGSSSNLTSGGNNIFVGFAAGNAENNVNNAIEIGNNGPGPGNGAILIGTEGTQVARTYVAGIYDYVTTFTPAVPVVTVDSTGHLGWQNITPGGGGLGGTCNTPGSIAEWLNSNTLECSAITQQGNNIGIGNPNPSTPLEVGGAITADTWYDISPAEIPVLSIGRAVLPTNDNLFVGVGAGENNPLNPGGGTDNTFSGYQAGFNATGGLNTFSGSQAGYGNTTGTPNSGNQNTFTGYWSGYFNTSGSYNTFSGMYSGRANTSGSSNTFTGAIAGDHNESGNGNSFYGYYAGLFNDDGGNNTCLGSITCGTNISGNDNTVVGAAAGGNFRGSNNIFVGYNAGSYDYYNYPTNSDGNIYVGSQGCTGGVGCYESNFIRIGNQLDGSYTKQNQVFFEPILVSTIAARNSPVCIDATGALGTAATCNPGSSRRFKDQIANMGGNSSKLFQLRPVSFFYKPQYDDGSHSLQYGLIAEEVAEVYPEMVIYDKDGQPSGVKYQLLAPMLLNELQKEHAVVMSQQDELQTQLQQIKAQRQEIDGLKRDLQLQNASLQERLQKLESYVATQVKTASEVQTAATTATAGGLR